MNFQVFGNRIKLFFLITIIFLLLTIGMLVAFLIVKNEPDHTWYLMMFLWFGTTTTLLFHYLLWRNLPFLQALDVARTNNYTFFLSLIVYIILFPIIGIVSLVFLVIFVFFILILWIKSLFKSKKGKNNNY